MKKICLLLCVILLITSALAAFAEPTRVLKYGSKGDDVTALQERLTDLGYYTFRITGNYQERTEGAIKAFQKNNGLKQTGIADLELQNMIFAADALPKVTPTPALDMKVSYPGFPLQYGATGEDVRRIQSKLTDLGYYTIEISGKYLGNTRNAVRDFQRMNGLEADGVVGKQTWELLFFGDALNVDATPRPTPEPTPVPYRLEVDVTNQITSVYGLDASNHYTRLIKQMICSTGTERDPSPLGVFTLNGRTARWCYFDEWDTHAQYWTRITPSIAFHSVIYTDTNEKALKTASYRALGSRASHGCIRLLVDDAHWIYSNCGAGTEVVIFEGVADPELTESLKPGPLDREVMLPSTTPEPEKYPVYDPEALPPMPFKTLEKGSAGLEVYWLQCRLTELGYYSGSITGGYFDGTKEAVKTFQRDNGISADGKAGKETLNLIYAEVLATPAPTTKPTSVPEPIMTPSTILDVAPSATVCPTD